MYEQEFAKSKNLLWFDMDNNKYPDASEKAADMGVVRLER